MLLAEDDPGDALLIQESFGPADSSNRRCHVASHSDEALRFVRGIEPSAAPGHPDDSQHPVLDT